MKCQFSSAVKLQGAVRRPLYNQSQLLTKLPFDAVHKAYHGTNKWSKKFEEEKQKNASRALTKETLGTDITQPLNKQQETNHHSVKNTTTINIIQKSVPM